MLADLRHALRLFGRQRLVTAIALAAIALGTGANTAIFSVVHAVLLRPLPYPGADRIVRVWEDSPKPGVDEYFTSIGMVRDLSAAKSLEHLAAYWFADMNFSDGAGTPERVRTVSAGAGLIDVLGVTPVRGRLLADQDYTGNSSFTAVLLTHGFWQQRYSGRDDAIGRTVRIDENAGTIVGVLPPGVTLEGAQIWTNHVDRNTAHQPRYLHALGRLRSGVTLDQARSELTLLVANVALADPRAVQGWTVVVKSLTDDIVGSSRMALVVLFGAASLLLLIACANVASLLLAQAEGRTREIAIRAAVGASAWRLTRQLIVESGLLALAGTALGLGLAWLSIRTLRSLGPESLPRIDEITLHWPVLAYALGLAIVTSLLFGLAPMWRARRPDLHATMHDAGRGSSAGRASQRVRQALVIGEMALAVVLVTAAGLLVKSFARLASTDVGFAVDRMLTFELALPYPTYRTAQLTTSFYDRLLDGIVAVPGVRAVGSTTSLPLARESDFRVGFSVTGDAPASPNEDRAAWYRMVSPGYFAAMGIPLRQGRLFAESDRADSTPVVIVNEALVRRYIGGRNPIGLTLNATSGTIGPLGAILVKRPTIVGVVGNVRHAALEQDAEPAIFYPLRQAPFRKQAVVVRAQGDPNSLAADLRRVVASIDPGLPIARLETLDMQIARASAAPRFRTWLITAFAGLALALGAVGLYGVLSFMVASRSREIGIRLALGGRPADVRALVLRQSMTLVAIGSVLGLIGAFAASRLIEGLLYGVQPHDPLTFAIVPIVLVATALLASWLPARRATRVDPVAVLRQ